MFFRPCTAQLQCCISVTQGTRKRLWDVDSATEAHRECWPVGQTVLAPAHASLSACCRHGCGKLGGAIVHRPHAARSAPPSVATAGLQRPPPFSSRLPSPARVLLRKCAPSRCSRWPLMLSFACSRVSRRCMPSSWCAWRSVLQNGGNAVVVDGVTSRQFSYGLAGEPATLALENESMISERSKYIQITQ
jgi:hypothetical protein